jgi:chromosomal replication initiation ATPase DnaA
MTNGQTIRARQDARSIILKELSKHNWSPRLIRFISASTPEPSGTVIPKEYKIDILADAVSDLNKVDKNIILSKCRVREAVMSRMMMCKFLREEEGLTLQHTGKLLNIDHTTVLYAIRTLNNDIETNYRGLRDKYAILLEKMQES